jgi:hypothetical protein
MAYRRAISLCLLLAAVACGGSSGPSRPPVASVTLTVSSSGPLTSLGDTLVLTAVARDASGAAILGVSVVFTSSNAGVATVSEGGGVATTISQLGVVTAVSNGVTTIHAAAEGKEATLDVTVAQVVAQVLVTPGSIRVPPGETPLFRATPVDARNHPVAGAPAAAWATSDPSVATIGADGRAAVSSTASDGATATAIATVGTVSSTTGGLMTVDSTAVYVETITVTAQGSTSFSKLNDTVQLSATASNPRQGDVTSMVSFTWSTSAMMVASVSSSGLVTSAGNGNASISATSNGVSASIGVAVAQIVATVSVATSAGGSSASLASLGATVSLVATAFDSGGSAASGATFSWSSDATSVATVSSSGIVTAVTNGTAHVTARATSNQVASPALTVTVQQVVASVAVLPATASIPRCTMQQFSATPRDARGNTVAGAPAATWASADQSIATMNGNFATGVSTGGPVAIQATVSGVTGSAQLTVNTSRSC